MAVLGYKFFKALVLLGLLRVNFSNSQSVTSIATNFCQQNQGLDNFSCSESPIEGTNCFNRSEVCNGEFFCSGGEDEGSDNILSGLQCKR